MSTPAWVPCYEPLAEAVVRLFSPHVEVVLHDIGTDTIVGIWNPFSARRVGAPSLLEPELLQRSRAASVVGPYEKAGLYGESISAVSVVVAEGAGLLCLNFDRSVTAGAADALRAFGAPVVGSRPAALFERDWQEEMNRLVLDWCVAEKASVRHLSPDARRRLVAVLDAKGVFRVRGAAVHLAAALGVSRATVYATLKAAREAAELS
jgi:predicted transcriptional regulator YheO